MYKVFAMNPVRVFLTLLSCCAFLSAVSSTAAGTETLIGIAGDGFVLLAADTAVSSGGIAFQSSEVDKIAVLDDDRMLVAAAGDAADADRLIGILRAECAMAAYYESTRRNSGRVPGDDGNGDCEYGDDGVTYVDCSGTCSLDAPATAAATTRISSSSSNGRLTVECVAQAARYMIWQRLRSSHQPAGGGVCMLIAGMSKDTATMVAAASGAEGVVQRQVDLATASMLSLTESATSDGDSGATTSSDVSHKETNDQSALFWLDEYGALQRVSYAAHGHAATMLWSVLDRGYSSSKKMKLDQALALLKECLAQLKTRYLISTRAPFCVKCIDANGSRVIRLEKDEEDTARGDVR